MYKHRLEDEDLEIAPIFNLQNRHYREKFDPVPSNELELEKMRRLREEEGYREAKTEKKIRKQKRLEFFNKKYKGQYVELEEHIEDFKKNPIGNDNFYRPILELHERDKARVRELERQRRELVELHKQQQDDLLKNLNYRRDEKQYGRNASSAKLASSQGGIVRRAGRLTSLVRKNNSPSVTVLKPGGERNNLESPSKQMRNFSIEEMQMASPPTAAFGRLPDLKKPKQQASESDDFRVACGMGCGRKFAPELIERHEAICQQVFVIKKPPADMKAKRLAKTYKR